jgi:hypothetical protein
VDADLEPAEWNEAYERYARENPRPDPWAPGQVIWLGGFWPNLLIGLISLALHRL